MLDREEYPQQKEMSELSEKLNYLSDEVIKIIDSKYSTLRMIKKDSVEMSRKDKRKRTKVEQNAIKENDTVEKKIDGDEQNATTTNLSEESPSFVDKSHKQKTHSQAENVLSSEDNDTFAVIKTGNDYTDLSFFLDVNEVFEV